MKATRGFTFSVEHSGESGAGIHPFSDVVHISIDSGDPGGDIGEFEGHMLAALREWYDGACVEEVAPDA